MFLYQDPGDWEIVQLGLGVLTWCLLSSSASVLMMTADVFSQGTGDVGWMYCSSLAEHH